MRHCGIEVLHPFWVFKVFFCGEFWSAFGEVERSSHFLDGGGGW